MQDASPLVKNLGRYGAKSPQSASGELCSRENPDSRATSPVQSRISAVQRAAFGLSTKTTSRREARLPAGAQNRAKCGGRAAYRAGADKNCKSQGAGPCPALYAVGTMTILRAREPGSAEIRSAFGADRRAAARIAARAAAALVFAPTPARFDGAADDEPNERGEKDRVCDEASRYWLCWQIFRPRPRHVHTQCNEIARFHVDGAAGDQRAFECAKRPTCANKNNSERGSSFLMMSQRQSFQSCRCMNPIIIWFLWPFVRCIFAPTIFHHAWRSSRPLSA